MTNNFRKKTYEKFLKNAGVVSDMVDKALDIVKPFIKYTPIGSVGPGTTVMVPENAAKADGSVDIVFQIRGLSGGDTKGAGGMGVQAVVITAEAGGMGSKENLASYGSPAFISKAVNSVLANLQKKYPDKKIHLGKLTISSFSGGGSATAALLANRKDLPRGSTPPKFVFIDGLHSDKGGSVMKEVMNFANVVKDNPEAGELSIVHTAVVPTGYRSTTDVADEILGATGLTRKSVKSDSKELNPATEAQQGGLKIIQLYNKPEPYMVKDPVSGELKANIPGTAGYQHIKSLEWGLKNMIS